MNFKSGLNYSIHKDKNYIKKDLLKKNITKIVSLIISNKPIAYINSNYHNNFSHKIQIGKKGYSMKDFNLKNFNNSIKKDSQKFLIKDASKNNIQKRTSNNLNNIINKIQSKRKNNSFYSVNNFKDNENIKYNEIPINSTSYPKKKKNIINSRRVNSVSKIKKAKSFCKSKNLNFSLGSVDIKKMTKKRISFLDKSENKKENINMSLNKKNKNKDNSKVYLIKKRKNFSHDIKTKINLYIEQQKKYSQREYINKDKYYTSLIKKNINNNNISFSYDIHKKMKKLKTNNNNTFGNITTNNSDKENTNMTTKKNNITTTYSNTNNIHYYTTNFNSSTNITETNNDLYNEHKGSKEKRFSKKKVKLPFHPYSKKEEEYNHSNIAPKKYLIRNNRSEINIPYNKKNKASKIKRENSTNNFTLFNLKNKKIGKIKMNKNNTSRQNNNTSLIDLYEKNNFINSSETLHIKNKIYFHKNDLTISSKDKDKELSEGIEMNHFRIVSIIQENKRLLMQNDKCK